MAEVRPREGLTAPDDVPAPPKEAYTKLGDVWLLGQHRVMCGDTTVHANVERLTGGAQSVVLIHADPPYGMGKESDGVLNDNLYGAKLDSFQMRWWQSWLPVLAPNSSAYIWGNAPDLWRLWYAGGLESPDLLVRNEIVWDKGSAIGMKSELGHSYPPSTERCLFLMRGQQFLGNQNKEDYWEGYEPLRTWLNAQVELAGWTKQDVNAITGKQMAGHWLSQSQFQPIPERDYLKLQAAANGRAFIAGYSELFDQMFPGSAHNRRRELSAQIRNQRTYFDNAHDIMTDVWQYPRVIGDERFEHATPKPVAMVERAIKSSCPEGGTVAAPFGGTGPEVIAAERLGRKCVAMELQPTYVDVICRRFQEHTGILPILEATGEEHDFTS